jgi:[ribosomal protein S5]-alanine N-acetyltransferase
MQIPTLATDRLLLRPFRMDNVPAVERMLSTPHVAEYTLSFPHPSPPGFAHDWISRHARWAERGIHLQWAIALRNDTPVGAIGIALRTDPHHGDIGYWIGPDYWNNGYATEATKAVIAYGFDTLGLPRIQASCFVGNDASARVLQKAGMVEEGILHKHIEKDGVLRDVRMFAITGSAT